MSSLTGKRVVVVAGDVDGHAELIATHLGRVGATVTLLAGQTGPGLPNREGSARVQINYIDLTDMGSVGDVLSGGVDGWVNDVGVPSRSVPASSLDDGEWRTEVSDRLGLLFSLTRVAARTMENSNRAGVIVNLASADAFRASEHHVAASVLSAGIVTLTKALGVEWASRGIRVVGVAIPAVRARTPLRRAPMRRTADPLEIASAVEFLLSDEAGYVVAEMLVVDGGWSIYDLF
jgi:NAD(P)-dependent dehydrogenase (short-subunit alcohol dehydrogenase family)